MTRRVPRAVWWAVEAMGLGVLGVLLDPATAHAVDACGGLANAATDAGSGGACSYNAPAATAVEHVAAWAAVVFAGHTVASAWAPDLVQFIHTKLIGRTLPDPIRSRTVARAMFATAHKGVRGQFGTANEAAFGHSSGAFDLNELNENFPGVDAIDGTTAYSCKFHGIDGGIDGTLSDDALDQYMEDYRAMTNPREVRPRALARLRGWVVKQVFEQSKLGERYLRLVQDHSRLHPDDPYAPIARQLWSAHGERSAHVAERIGHYQQALSTQVTSSVRTVDEVADALLRHRPRLVAEGRWPAGLPLDDAADQHDRVVQFLKERTVMVVPDDHVAAVQDRLIHLAQRAPHLYGVAGLDESAIELQIRARVRGAGIDAGDVEVLHTFFRAEQP